MTTEAMKTRPGFQKQFWASQKGSFKTLRKVQLLVFQARV